MLLNIVCPSALATIPLQSKRLTGKHTSHFLVKIKKGGIDVYVACAEKKMFYLAPQKKKERSIKKDWHQLHLPSLSDLMLNHLNTDCCSVWRCRWGVSYSDSSMLTDWRSCSCRGVPCWSIPHDALWLTLFYLFLDGSRLPSGGSGFRYWHLFYAIVGSYKWQCSTKCHNNGDGWHG